MTDLLIVILDNAIIGRLTRAPEGNLRFEYDDEYRSRPNPTALSLSMPTAIKTHSNRVVTPWLWGLLPENPAVLDRWGREFQVSVASPFGLLGSPVGEDCAGAVRFAHPDQIDRVLNSPGGVAWLSDNQVEERLRDLREDSTAWLGRSFTGRFSLAGSQAKTALVRTGGRWGLPYGSTPTTHILKPAAAGLAGHDLNEHLCLDAARRAGLLAARTTVERIGKESAVVVDRYDRQNIGASVRRVHQEDLCQALGVFPSRKYQSDGGPSPGDISKLLRRAVAPSVAEEAIRRFADILIWNWFIAGTDAHAKNYSIVLQNREVRLAPMYDVASGLPYGTHERKLRFAMKIGGDYRVYPNRNTWRAAARELALDPDLLIERVREVGARVSDCFLDAAGEAPVKELDSPFPPKLLDLVADRAARCMRILDTAPADASMRQRRSV